MPPLNLAPSAILACLSLLGAHGLYKELQIYRLEDQAKLQAAAARLDLATSDTTVSTGLSPRAAALRSVMRTRAALQPGPQAQRTALLDLAVDDAEHAIAARPHWGPGWLAATYAFIARDGAESAPALHAFAESYRANGYLYDAADWRLQFAVNHWKNLSAETREAAAREGRWLRMLGGNLQVHVYVLTGGTPLYDRIAGGKAPFIAPPRRY
jgi:hypothetical protein